MNPRYISLLLAVQLFLASLVPSAFSAPNVDAAIEAARKRAIANSSLYYDEVFDAEGNIRPHYRDIFPEYASKTPAELEAIRKSSLRSFRGDNSLSALPRVMPQSEFNEVKAGVEQRGKALLRFLQDHYSGQKTYLRDKVIPAEVMARILERSGDVGFEGKIKPELIRFMYGPDVIRDAQGVHRVLEDNTSFLGGQGDLPLAKKVLYRQMPGIAEALEKDGTVDPMDFYRNLIARYRADMKNPNEKMVVFAVPPYPDMEDARLKKIWDSLGVEWVIPGGRKGLVKKPDGMHLRWKENGVEKTEKVGFVIFNADFHGADNSYPVYREKWLLEEAKSRLALRDFKPLSPELSAEIKKALRVPPRATQPNLKKLEEVLKQDEAFKSVSKDDLVSWAKRRLKYQNEWPEAAKAALAAAATPDPVSGKIDLDALEKILRADKNFSFSMHNRTVPGLLEAIVSGQVHSNNMPGTEFINDKEFNMYVEDLIHHYLGEKPILRNLPSKKLYTQNGAGQRVVDEAVFRDLEQNMDKYVVKVVDGRGGEGIWVGPKLSAEQRRELLTNLRANTSRETIVQEYKHPSVLGPDIVDLRVLSQAGGPKGMPEMYVPDQGWVRAVGLGGDGKVNLSAGNAHEVAFQVRKDGPAPASPQRALRQCSESYRQLQMSR